MSEFIAKIRKLSETSVGLTVPKREGYKVGDLVKVMLIKRGGIE